MEANEILDNGHGTQQRSADTERGIGGKLVSSKTVPHAKVQPNRHEDAVQDDECPEPENGLLARPQRVLQRRRPSEIRVIVRDLGVGKSCVERVVYVWRHGSAGVGTGVLIHGGGAAISVGRARGAGEVEVCVCCVCCRRARGLCHLRGGRP